MKSTLQQIALILLLLMAFISANAGTKTWKSTGSGGSWGTASNWTEGSVPVANDNVTINPSANISITGVPVLTINSLTVNGSGTVNLTSSNTLTFLSGGSITINAGNTLNMIGTKMALSDPTTGTLTTSGTGSLTTTVTTAASLPTTSAGTGITFTFDVIFNGTANQSIPKAVFNNFTLNNTTALGSVAANTLGDVTINGNLTLSKGILACGTGTGRNLNLGSTATLTGGSSTTGWVYPANGTFIRKSVGTSATLFPIGTLTSYTPLTLTNTTGTPDITTTVKSTFTNAPFAPTKVVNLEWYVKSTVNSTADITYQFNTTDFAASYNVAAASEVGIYKTFYTATSLGIASGSNPYTLSTTSVGLSSTAIYNVIGNTGSVMDPNKNYLWNGTTSTDYQVASNWTPARNVLSSLDNLTITPSTATSITNVPNQTINSLTVNGSGTNTVTLSGVNTLTFSSGGSITINAGNTLNMSGTKMALSDPTTGTLTTSGTGSLITAVTTANSLPWTSAGTGITFTFDVTFNGTALQTIQKAVFNNFTLNNTTALGSVAANTLGDVTINGNLTLSQGILACGTITGRNLNLGSTATLTGGSSTTSWVYPANGTFNRKSVGTSSLLYPVGTLNSYAPLTITNSVGSPNISVKLKPTPFTNDPADPTKVVNLEWSVLSSVATTADITYQFNTADFASSYIVGSASELGNYKTSYTTSSVGIASGSNPYTLSATGLSIPSSGTNNYLIGNTYAVALTAPTAPTITSITPDNSQLSVAFTAPSSDGGSSISNYKYSTDGGATFTACSPVQTSSPIVITGLTNGTSYNVQIKAVNAIGDGTATPSTVATPLAVISPSVAFLTGLNANPTPSIDPGYFQTFTFSATGLVNDVTIIAPSVLELSTTGGNDFTSPITIAKSGSSISTTTIYVRAKAGLATQTFIAQNITLQSTGAVTQTIACSGVIDIRVAVDKNKLNRGVIRSEKGQLVLENLTGRAEIYTTSGNLVRSMSIASDKVSVSLAKGLYIVKNSGRATKIMIQ
jgi:hypothetical protein